MKSRILTLLVGILASATCFAQQGFYREGQYPSLRNLNGLPGQAFGINRQGHPDFRGAFSFSTPTAYALSDWHWVLSGTFVSNDLSLGFAESAFGATTSANGTGVLQIGTRLKGIGNFSYGFTLLSSELDNIGSAHFTPEQSGPVTFGIGIMDVSGSGGTSGFGNPGDNRSSRSPYVVGTYEYQPGTFITLGYGNTRFRGVFGSASTLITPRLRALLEYDTFHWNQMLAYDIGRVGPAHITATLGTHAGRYGTWALSFSF